MKIAVPTLGSGGADAPVSPHFGRCPTYTLMDEEGNVTSIIKNTSSHMGGRGLPPELLHSQGVDVLLCSGLGSRALEAFLAYGIDVYIGEAVTAGELFSLWKAGSLKNAEDTDACRGRHH